MSTDYKHDMARMLAFHDALRREVGHIARVTASRTDDPRHVMATAAGWQMFKTYLHVHHGCEDDVLWPALEKTLAGRPDDLADALATTLGAHLLHEEGEALALIDTTITDESHIAGRGGPPDMRAGAMGMSHIAPKAGDVPFTKGQPRRAVRPQGRS